MVAGSKVRTIDVGEVNGQTFLCASMLGLPARLGRTREETRGSAMQALSRMAPAMLQQLRRARRLRVRLVADGVPDAVRASSITVTVNAIDESSGRAFGRLLMRSARVPLPPVDWEVGHGPWFSNMIGALELEGRGSVFRLERTVAGDGEPLETVLEQRLA